MYTHKHIDEQMLASFVDGELDSQSSEIVIRMMEQDSEIREHIYQLRRAKDLMKLSFGDAAASSQLNVACRSAWWQRFPPRLVASFAAIVISFSAGLLSYDLLSRALPHHTEDFTASTPHQDRVILHISQASQLQYTKVLNYVDEFLREHRTDGSRIEVVAHANGINLLRQDTSPYRKRIMSLMEHHPNVHFVACANGLKLLRENGVAVKIIKGVATDETAMDHIIARIHQGWSYIKVDSKFQI